MTTLVPKRTLFDALIVEPLELAISQPHQALISAISVYLVASEAAMLAPPPFNWAMAIGVEWAYLRGLSSGDFVHSIWTRRLITSAVVLLILYGSLWGLRRFGVLPADAAYYATVNIRDMWGIVGAIVLTLVHILAIGAVTFCSAMIHRDILEVQRVSREKVAAEEEQRNHAQRAESDARSQRLQRARDELTIEMQRKDAELRLMEETERRKMQLRSERAQLRVTTRPAQPGRNQKIVYGDVEYPSVQAAADAHGISRQAMSKRLRSRSRQRHDSGH